MNWYKINKYKISSIMDIENLKDRSVANAKIRKLKNINETLRRAIKISFQTSRGARRLLRMVLIDKSLSSYPDTKSLLLLADKKVMDNPSAFNSLCQNAIINIENIIKELKVEVEIFTNKKLNEKMKNLKDNK